MHYSQEYAEESQQAYARAPTESNHAPAYYYACGHPVRAWNGRQLRGNQAFQYVQSQQRAQVPTAQRMPVSFNVTPGYFLGGCWYNAGLQKHPVALVPQQEVAPAQLQQHVAQVYMQPPQQEQQFVPQSSSLQQEEHAAPSYSSQQVPSFYGLQQQQQPVMTPYYPWQNQVQVLPSSYVAQHQVHVLPPSYPTQQLLPPSYPTQQLLPPSYFSLPQQVMPPSVLPIPTPLQQQQRVMPPYPSYPSEPVQQNQGVSQAMSQEMPAPQIMPEETPVNQENQENQETQAAQGSQVLNETITAPPQVVETSLGPGVQVTRSQDKITIDIGLSNADNAVTVKHGCLEDMISKLFNLVRRCASTSRVARARRNRLRLRRQFISKRAYKAGSPMNDDDDDMQNTVMEDKNTQTIEDPAPIQLEELPAQAFEAEEIPVPEVADNLIEIQEVLSTLLAATETLIREEDTLMETLQWNDDDNQDSASEYLPEPVQEQKIASTEATPEPVYLLEEKILPPMISTSPKAIGKARTPSPPPPFRMPEVFGEPKEPIVDTSYWPPLGSRPTKASKGKQRGTPEEPKEDPPKQQPSRNHRPANRRSHRKSARRENNLSKSSGGKVEVGVPRADLSKSSGGKAVVAVPKAVAADVQNSGQQNLKAPQNGALNSRNDKKIQKSPQVEIINSPPQNQKPSVQNSKGNPSEPQAVARNMFALLGQLVEEPSPSPAIKAEVENQEAKGTLEKERREAARNTKKQKRHLKKKERAQRIRHEAKEKAANEALEAAITKIQDNPRIQALDLATIFQQAFPDLDLTPKPQSVTTKETPAEVKPIFNDLETVEKEIVASLDVSLKISRKPRIRSPFLEAVSTATARKSAEETPLAGKRNLWEKRQPEGGERTTSASASAKVDNIPN